MKNKWELTGSFELRRRLGYEKLPLGLCPPGSRTELRQARSV